MQPTTPPPLPSIPYAGELTPMPSRRGQGFLAVCASLVLPGLGHLFARRSRRALAWFLFLASAQALLILCLVMPSLTPGLILLAPLGTLGSILMLFDSYLCGNRAAWMTPPKPRARYLLGIGLLVVAWFSVPQLRLAYYVRDHYAEAFVNGSAANAPTIQPNDRIVVHKKAEVRRWSLVAFHSREREGETYVFRVVGLPGERIDIQNGDVIVNGIAVPRPKGVAPYVRDLFPSAPPNLPTILLEDEYFLLGDNTRMAADSRVWRQCYAPYREGALHRKDIVGVVTYIYWPPERWASLTPP